MRTTFSLTINYADTFPPNNELCTQLSSWRQVMRITFFLTTSYAYNFFLTTCYVDNISPTTGYADNFFPKNELHR
jgi:hypothetical protein